jgi:DNA-binding NarL/FixJ family response regulator
LLDYELTQQTTIQNSSDIHRLKSQCKVIVLSLDPEANETFLAAGVDGFINKNYPPDKLLPIHRNMRLSKATV